jgi:hypothetical protein
VCGVGLLDVDVDIGGVLNAPTLDFLINFGGVVVAATVSCFFTCGLGEVRLRLIAGEVVEEDFPGVVVVLVLRGGVLEDIRD